MSNRTQGRIGAVLSLLAIVLMSFATFLMIGRWDFRADREAATVLLLIWLSTGSNLARRIVGVLSVCGVLIGGGGAISLTSQRTGLEPLTTAQQSAFGVFAMGVMIHGCVAWLLLFRRRTP